MNALVALILVLVLSVPLMDASHSLHHPSPSSISRPTSDRSPRVLDGDGEGRDWGEPNNPGDWPDLSDPDIFVPRPDSSWRPMPGDDDDRNTTVVIVPTPRNGGIFIESVNSTDEFNRLVITVHIVRANRYDEGIGIGDWGDWGRDEGEGDDRGDGEDGGGEGWAEGGNDGGEGGDGSEGGGEGEEHRSTVQVSLSSFTRLSRTVASTAFKVRFDQLIEYVEVDGISGLSGNDTIGNVVDVGALTYTFKQLPSAGTSNSPILVVTANSGLLDLTIFVGSSLYNNSGVIAYSNTGKVNVDVNNFNYTLANSRLALSVEVLTDKKRCFTRVDRDQRQPHQDWDRIAIRSCLNQTLDENDSDQDDEGYFSWAKTVTADSATAAVFVTSDPPRNRLLRLPICEDDNDQDRFIYSFNAVHAARIHWDPLVGVGAASYSGVSMLVPGTGFGFLLLVWLVAVLLA